ncbi:TPA: hypothetical protein N3288_000218 [Klebsiella aerogenes]|nr:hypothetical protein [Klebsiella aerogenes]
MIKHTILTAKEASQRYEDDSHEILTGKGRVLMREYTESLSRLEMIIQQYLPNLLNPMATAKTDEWRQVQELAYKLAFGHVDERHRNKIAELESQLKDMGVL